MLKPSTETIKAIINLESNPFWKEVVKWLNDSLISQSIQNNKNRGEDTIKMQGRNIEIAELLHHIKESRTYAENERHANKMEE